MQISKEKAEKAAKLKMKEEAERDQLETMAAKQTNNEEKETLKRNKEEPM
jgi:hypothetical protein